MKAYEGLFILETAGQEDASKELLDKIQKEIEAVGGRVDSVQKLGLRTFARGTEKRSAGFYVNYLFRAPANAIAELDAKFHLDPEIFRWQFLATKPAADKLTRKRKKGGAAKTRGSTES